LVADDEQPPGSKKAALLRGDAVRDEAGRRRRFRRLRRRMTESERQRIHLLLSAGGVRCLSYIGALFKRSKPRRMRVAGSGSPMPVGRSRT